MDAPSSDPLISLRRSIASNHPPIPTSSPNPTQPSDAIENLAVATHLQFADPEHISFPLNTPTRFISSEKPVDLRSIYFAWQKKDVAIPDYIASAQQLNEKLFGADGGGSKVQNLVFVERLDLITWLEGASEESEYIKALESDIATARSAQVASGAAGGIPTIPSSTAGARAGKTIDPRLQEIYNGERRMGDRNSVLRGIKPTVRPSPPIHTPILPLPKLTSMRQDFSHIRKSAESFLARNRTRPGAHPPSSTGTTAPPSTVSNASSLVSLPKKPSRRPDPIILLSPSASSLLRMSNIKSFLEAGTYIPPDSALAGSSGATATILHISRLLPAIDASRPLRFILVDTPEQFKPDYWSRVVAVFTTGQTWQFRGYKWQSPPELFRHVLGIYVGWRGEDVPTTVRGWGRGVSSAQIE
ncbi:accessory factor associated with RNA polymerase II, partial [Sticta canariensis]|nr:accessory factor associated with RNA polymerase II [Sticta canariensis]